jgi:hypothetical protein
MAILITILTSYLAIAINSSLLKVITVASWMYATIKVRIRRTARIKFQYLFSILLLVSITKSAIVESSVPDFFRVILVDGLYYYFLAVFIAGNEALNRLNKKQIILSGLILLLIVTVKFNGTNVGYAYGIIEYLLIPSVFFLRKNFTIAMLLVSIGILVALSVNSRSYTLFFTLNSLLLIYTGTKRRVLTLSSFVILGVLVYNLGYMDGIIEKFMSTSKNSVIAGDSRLFLLSDAFGSMTLLTFLFGNGFAATYTSFVERSTIEIGLLQDAFYFGFPFAFWYLGSALNKARKYRQVDFFITGFILIHVIDYLIYCQPRASFYRLLCITLIFSNDKKINKASTN